jgi:hypothetical protein
MGMFAYCTNLTKSLELPATNLANNCYRNMFSGCTSLAEAPELLATTLANNCYRSMFNGCTNLNKIIVNFTDWNETNNSTTSWVNNVSSNGTFICPTELTIKRGVNYIPENWTVINDSDETPLTFTADNSNSTIKLSKSGSPVIDGLQYRLNKNDNWQQYTLDTVITLPNVGDYVQFRNTKNELSTSIFNYVQFKMTGKIAASGNIQSMLNYSNSCTPSCYRYMFYNCINLTTAPELPATNLANSCYSDMFRDCKNLIKTPELPATNLAISCYSYMFWNCTSLTVAPELPATNLAKWCYGSMFWNCTSLTVAPKLPATTLADYCYYGMFRGCTSLTEAPELPATTLVDSCYNEMFYDCTSLTEIKVLFTDWKISDISDTSDTYGWVTGVSSAGTFYKPSALPKEYGDDYIPNGWTVVNI